MALLLAGHLLLMANRNLAFFQSFPTVILIRSAINGYSMRLCIAKINLTVRSYESNASFNTTYSKMTFLSLSPSLSLRGLFINNSENCRCQHIQGLIAIAMYVLLSDVKKI